MTQEIEILIAKLLCGNIDDSEVCLLEEWIKKDKSNQEQIEDMYVAWSFTEGSKMPESMINSAMRKVEKSVGIIKDQKQKKSSYLPMYSGIAAAIIAIICIVGLSLADFNSGVEYSVKLGGHPKTFVLKDNTCVTLNVGSKLTVPKNFNANKNREVRLEGEAIFDVRKNENCPFVVYTKDNSKITVLGTVFNLKAYKNEANTEITLKEGNISFLPSCATQDIQIEYDEQIIYNASQKTIEIAVANPNISMSWQYDQLIFADETLDAILNTISRNYDLDLNIRFSDISLLNKRYSCEFQKSDGVDMILKKLSAKANFEYRVDNDDIHIWS